MYFLHLFKKLTLEKRILYIILLNCNYKIPPIMLVYVLLAIYLVCLYVAYKGAATSEN